VPSRCSTSTKEIFFSGADLRAAERQAGTIQPAEPGHQFLDVSARVEDRRSVLARTRDAWGLLGLAALVELVVIAVLLAILFG